MLKIPEEDNKHLYLSIQESCTLLGASTRQDQKEVYASGIHCVGSLVELLGNMHTKEAVRAV